MRYKAIIAYDGTNFNGFQLQPQAKTRTVQGELETCLKGLNSGLAVSVQASGRTDSGVHAKGQVLHFDLQGARDTEKLRFALDTQTPADIAVLSIEAVSDDFHARYTPHEKRYEYYVDLSRARDPFKRYYMSHYRYQLDLEVIKVALGLLEGTHDFTGFTATGSSVDDKVRTIYTAKLDVIDQTTIRFVFEGNGFLYKQIRNMVGTLLAIGNGRMPVTQVNRILTEKNRQLAGPTAPPEGLYLVNVRYV